MIRFELDRFVSSVNQGHSGNIKRSLECDSEVANLIGETKDASRISACEPGMGVWRRMVLEQMCVLGQLTESMVVALRVAEY